MIKFLLCKATLPVIFTPELYLPSQCEEISLSSLQAYTVSVCTFKQECAYFWLQKYLISSFCFGVLHSFSRRPSQWTHDVIYYFHTAYLSIVLWNCNNNFTKSHCSTSKRLRNFLYYLTIEIKNHHMPGLLTTLFQLDIDSDDWNSL